MMNVELRGNGYKMRFSNPGTGWRGFSVQAGSVEEVQTAVEHYYRGHAASVPGCPLCRTIRTLERPWPPPPDAAEQEGGG